MATSAAIQNFSHDQLVASSSAASSSGVPVNIVRGVTGFKYGAGATAADFNYVAGQLAGWYTHFYQQDGNALIAWQKAAAQEMGPTASPLDVAEAASTQATVTTGLVLNPIFADIGIGAGAIDATAGTVGTDATSLGGDVADTTGVAGSGLNASDTPSTDAGTGTSSDTASSAATGAGSGAAGSALTKLGLAGLLGATGWEGILVRALEALAGAALILLGLQALTGGDGHPLRAVSKATGALL